MVLGGLLALGFIYYSLGQFYPDPAIAKALGPAGWKAFSPKLIKSIAASLSLGIGLVMLWIVSCTVALRRLAREKKNWGSLILINSLVFVVIALIGIRGQWLQGVRPLVWLFVFPIFWNVRAYEWAISDNDDSSQTKHSSIGLRRVLAFSVVIVMSLFWIAESIAVAKVVKGRTKVLMDMRSDRLGLLAGEPFVAFDVGFISYFSQGTLCDMNGLMHGPEFASSTKEERARICASIKPVFAFLTANQARFLRGYIDFDNWVVCREYKFTNVRKYTTHYLLINPDIAKHLCATPHVKYRHTVFSQ